MAGDILSATEALGETIIGCRDETEKNRRLAEPIVAGIRETRLNRIALTPENQGLELPLVDALEIYETLAGKEASVAWVVWNGSLPCLFSRYLGREARAQLFADPEWLYANSTRPTGRAVVIGEQYRVTGRWSLVSGCELAEWMPLMCLVEENGQPRMLAPGQPEQRFMFVRRSDAKILDTWYTGGLRGTGSHDVVVDEVDVPRHHSLGPMDEVTIGGPLASVPILATLAAGFAAQMLGVARAAVATAIEMGLTKISPKPVSDMRDKSLVQIAVADQRTAIAAARGHLREVASKLWQKAARGQEISVLEVTDLLMAARHAIKTGSRAVDAMYDAGGTAAIYVDSPLERSYRDARTMQQHVIAQPIWAEDAGRVLMGLEPTNPFYRV